MRPSGRSPAFSTPPSPAPRPVCQRVSARHRFSGTGPDHASTLSRWLVRGGWSRDAPPAAGENHRRAAKVATRLAFCTAGQLRAPKHHGVVRRAHQERASWAHMNANRIRPPDAMMIRMTDELDERRKRAETRRSTWAGGVATHAELARIDAAFWAHMTPTHRLQSIWSIVEDSLALAGDHGPTPRLQRLVGGVRRRKG